MVAVYVNDNFGKGNISLTSKSLSDYSINSQFTFYEVFNHRMAAVTSCENTIAPMERFHTDVTAAILVFQNNETAAMFVFRTNSLHTTVISNLAKHVVVANS